jgi:putative addiction module component (TIGR02574 family)
MTHETKILIEKARALPAEERIEIAEAIMASLDETDSALDQAWLAEARDRLAAYRRGELRARDFDDVMAKYAKS